MTKQDIGFLIHQLSTKQQFIYVHIIMFQN